MLKNLKRASAIMLSLAMAVQFGMADTYFANTLSEEPIIEETQEQEPVTVEEGSQQVAVEQTEAPAIDAKEEFVQVPETKSVTLSYVAEDGTILQDATTHEYEMGYSLNSDASVMLNFDGYTLKDVVMNDSQIVAAAQANLNVTSDLTSVKFVYQKVMTESHPEANEAQEENKTEEKTEEDAEADPEAKEELPEYPAFDMSATAGNVTVHVTAAEGVLPSGAQLIVKRVTRKAILNAVEETVTEKDKEVDSAIALDITIVNADGIEIQPNGIVNVSFENVAVGGEEVNVYHVTDDASTVTEVATNTQSFDANHFSIYVITGEKKVELTTFNFVAEGNTVSTQIVKTGDTLITPTAPDIAGKAFVEWQENGSKFDGFGAQTITKTETRTITAKYEDALYVCFYNPEGTQIMRTEKVADHKDHDYSHVSYDVDATHKLVGWAADQNGTTNIAKNIAVPKGSTSVNVYAIIKEGYWVTFDSDGGSAIDSQFVFDKISLNDQTTPTKPGYTFDGWYKDSTPVENGATVTSPMTLKAHWKAAKVSYTVIHWWENADDDGYSFHESENKTGLTGTEANAKAKSYEGFTAQPVTKKTIRGDGSTIVSVYYKRNVYEVKFYSYSTPGFGWWDPGKPSKEYEDLKITAKYGQDISKKWPTYKGSSTWRTNDGSGAYQVNIGTMPLGGATFYGPKTGDEYETAYYYVEALPGEASDVTVSGIGNYAGEFKKSYKITPREYTVTTESAKKVYDGTALTAGGKIEGIVDGEVVVVHTTGSQTEVGSTPNTYKLEWKKASSKNYKLKEDSIGTLTVTEQTIDPGKDPDKPNPNYSGVTINNPSNSVYDGKEHKWSPAVTDKEGNALVEGTDYEVAYSTSDFTNVTGTITVTITGIGNYTGTVTRTYEITPKAYTVTTNSAKKVYDGTALTAGGKVEGIVSGETVEFTITGSRTDEGTSKNTYSLKWNGSAIQTNYKLAKESIGDLTVTPKSIIPDEPNTPDDKKTGITVSDPKDSKYDGQEHREVLTVKDTKTGKDLIANKDYTVVYSDDLVNAGTVTIKVSGLGNYSGSFTKTYKITKRLVTLTSATVSKTYDGQALTNTSITVSGDGFVEGEGASYEVTGTQTSVGNSANAFEYKLNEKTLASNYDITKVVGTLTITAAPAPVTPPTSPTPVSPPPVTPRYIQQVVPALTPQEEVKKEKTPKAEPKEEKVEKVEKEKTPKARPEKFWALINLICAIVTVLFGLLLLISKRHKNKDDEEEDDETRQQTNNDDESKEQEKKRGAFTRVLAVLIAILSVVFFLVTEDLSLRWTWTDQWTIWMVVIGFVQIVVFFVGRKWKNVDDDEDEQAQQA